MTSCSLPFPPPVNNLFATYNGHRIPSRRYVAWKVDAAADILAQAPKRLTGRFSATLTFDRPTRAKRDLDGLAKAPLDALVKAGVIEDDHLADRIELAWTGDEPVKPARVHIVLEAA